jgi:hypothetical protein
MCTGRRHCAEPEFARSTGIDSKESIPLADITWRA